TYTIASQLLHDLQHPLSRHAHPSQFYLIANADVQQYLTELYGYEPSRHWTWLGCTFPPAEIKARLDVLPANVRPSRTNRKALVAFCERCQRDEARRKEEEAYAKREGERMKGEIEALGRIWRDRVDRTPFGVYKVIQTDGAAIGWYE
ncbi:MAG: hypothetical protein LQ341_007544, partial [Variospora aurantia]